VARSNIKPKQYRWNTSGEGLYRTFSFSFTALDAFRFGGSMYLVEYGDSTMPSQLLVFFKSSSFYPFLLQQSLGFLDFLAYCGGSLGLFLGFSVLSAIELVFFFTARVIIVKKASNKVEDISSSDEKTAIDITVETFNASTIHGLKNCIDKQTPLPER
jgi:uncharacterized membrane protein